MKDRLFWVIFGLLVTIGVHLAYVIGFPILEINRRMDQLETLGLRHQMQSISGPVAKILPVNMAQMVATACLVDVNTGAVVVSGQMPTGYWLASLYDGFGQPIFTLDDLQAGGRNLHLRISNKSKPENTSTPAHNFNISVKLPRAILVLQARLPAPNYRQHWLEQLKNIRCLPET